MKQLSRRAMLPATLSSIAVVPRSVLGGAGNKSPSDKLNIAAVGVGGVCGSYLRGCEGENVVALCDVDDDYAAPRYEEYPTAKHYRDYRKMLDEDKSIDAVVIATPDHTHAVIAAAAMKAGKAVYCAKPMTRTIAEARTLAKIAKQTGVATQMSVQSCASDQSLNTIEWVRSGVIGQVREAHVWSNRPIWPQGVRRPKKYVKVPDTLDWDLWLGPAPPRPYHPSYHPWIWRGWWDFGTGAMGDMGCHTMHVLLGALQAEQPSSVHATAAAVYRGYRSLNPDGTRNNPRRADLSESAPHASIITWDFAARGDLPPARITWYDGGLKPQRPPELEPDRELGIQGILFRGDKGVILSGFTGGPELLPAKRNQEFTPPAKTLTRSIGHYKEWIAAAKGGEPAKCEFGFGSLLTEVALLGCIAVRTESYLEWDPTAMRITNNEEANEYIDEPYQNGWAL